MLRPPPKRRGQRLGGPHGLRAEGSRSHFAVRTSLVCAFGVQYVTDS